MGFRGKEAPGPDPVALEALLPTPEQLSFFAKNEFWRTTGRCAELLMAEKHVRSPADVASLAVR